MSRILKKLKALLTWIPKGYPDIWYALSEEPKIYPFRFKNEEERKAHERKLDLYINLNNYY